MTETAVATMQAAVIVEPRRLEVRTAPIPEPGAQEVRVRVGGCGVCASNIPPWEGRDWFSYPMEPGALGHEGWGVVDSLGQGVSDIQVGDRISFLSNHSYAEYDLAKQGAWVKIPASLDGQPFPGEPLGCAMNIFRRSHIRPGETVAIVGIGFLGALLTRLCSQAGARVLAVGRKSLDIAQAMGADETILMDDHWCVIERVKELTGGVGCDVVIEATGKQWPLDVASELTKEMGRLVIAGYHQDGLRQVNLQLWNWRGLEVTNAHEREPEKYRLGMEEAARAVESGLLDPTPLYTHILPLSELATALELTRERPPGFMKALVTMGDAR